MAHLLNPYLILVSAFLLSAGFAFSSPAHSSVIAEMVSAEELGSAYTLAGLQMDISGIGPLLSALASIGRSKLYLWRQAWAVSIKRISLCDLCDLL
jgi:MFS family permease